MSNEVFLREEMLAIKGKFVRVNEDKDGRHRQYFDNAGGSFRLKTAEDAFHRIDEIPDCSERNHAEAKFLQEIEEQGKEDARTVFNTPGGVIATSFTASMLMFEIIRAITENATGTNMVTTVLEHPSSFDAMASYARLHGCELRVAPSDPLTGGVSVDAIVSLVDKNTRVLSVMAASNISGHIFDLEEVVQRARAISPDLYIVIDAVQHAPHAALDAGALGVDAMTFAPYKFFGVRGLGLGYLSERVARFPHHRLDGKAANDWELGSPAPAHYAAVSAIVDYVCELGVPAAAPAGTNRRELFVAGMERIHDHETVLLEAMLEGTGGVGGLRGMAGVQVAPDNPDLSERDLILGMSFDAIDPASAVTEYEKRGVIVYERVRSSLYSRRMLDSFGLEGIVRVSPLHCNSLDDVEEFLAITREISRL